MPTSIPYDPSLVLGNVVEPDTLNNLLAISALQAPIDSAQDELNSYISMKRSLDMTVQELLNMSIDPSDLINQSSEVGKEIAAAATKYAQVRIAQEKQIQPLKATIKVVNANLESPIDYVRTDLKKMPLSADSLKMDAQYFSFDENEQSASNTMAAIKGFVSESTSFLGDDISSSMSSAATTQISKQRENHDVAGTLVITVGCTHKDAVLLAPFVLDVDKAVRVWNQTFKDDNDKIKVNDVASMEKIAAEEGTDAEKSLNILSGATYGSSFVGMVHVLRTESTQSSQAMSSLAASMQEQFQVGGWFADSSGGFGVDSSFSDDIKNLLSSQNITSHISLITMGSIPSIKSNQVAVGVKQFVDFDPAKMMGNLATLANATAADKKSVAESATAARTGKQMLEIQGATVQNVMAGLDKIDDGANKILDINSLMTALEDYIDKAIAGNIGVPINYYLKGITRAQLAQMWVAKYFPNKYLSISGDDSSGGKAPASASAQTADSAAA